MIPPYFDLIPSYQRVCFTSYYFSHRFVHVHCIFALPFFISVMSFLLSLQWLYLYVSFLSLFYFSSISFSLMFISFSVTRTSLNEFHSGEFQSFIFVLKGNWICWQIESSRLGYFITNMFLIKPLDLIE